MQRRKSQHAIPYGAAFRDITDTVRNPSKDCRPRGNEFYRQDLLKLCIRKEMSSWWNIRNRQRHPHQHKISKSPPRGHRFFPWWLAVTWTTLRLLARRKYPCQPVDGGVRPRTIVTAANFRGRDSSNLGRLASATVRRTRAIADQHSGAARPSQQQ